MQEQKVVIATRVSPALAAQVEQLAKEEMIPIAALVRRLLAVAVQRRAA